MHQVFRVLAVSVSITLIPVVGLPQKTQKKDTKYYNSLGLQDIKQGQYDQAIKMFDKAIKSDPNHDSAYINSGLTYFHQKAYDKAIVDYNKAIQ